MALDRSPLQGSALPDRGPRGAAASPLSLLKRGHLLEPDSYASSYDLAAYLATGDAWFDTAVKAA
ncbi:MAG: hypothetical protein JWP17_3428 [Solirubrobacterales bacterium]|jgi:hypothetical protein|nr:hypothetical protein [Solirubrobacterales bacterium]